MAKPRGKRPPATTRVGLYAVPLRDANFPTVVYFQAGEHGAMERGAYHFWTAVLRRPTWWHERKRHRRVVIGRALAVLPPGERFDRIRVERRTAPSPAERKHDDEMWENVLRRGSNIAHIRPSTPTEVKRWCLFHERDARHIFRGTYGWKSISEALVNR